MPINTMLDTVSSYIDGIPPIQQPMRFGNKAFRVFLDKVKSTIPELLVGILKTDALKRASIELQEYLFDSFGSYERIDFGSQ